MKTTTGNHLALKYLSLLCVLAIGMAGLLSAGAFSVLAQEPQTITATGTLTGEAGKSLPLTLNFPPAGGKVTGSAHYQEEWSLADVNCLATSKLNFEGTFTGGDGGSLTGRGTGTGETNCDNGDSLTAEYDGTWSGSFHANGTGNGIWEWEGGLGGTEVWGLGQVPWQVTFSSEEFQAALGMVDAPDESQPEQPPAEVEAPAEAGAEAADEAVTTESIYNTYGITLEESFGEDGYARTTWTDHELSLVNDVLKELPPALIKKMAVTRIVRNKVRVDKDGHPKPGARGLYYPCDKRVDPDCTGSSATIRIFDEAHGPSQFADDADGDRGFRATILHELTHALQAPKDKNAVYFNIRASSGGYAASPVVQNWMDATRNVTDMNNPQYFSDNNGWALVNTVWKLTTPQGNRPPTDYGATLPTEDMADSVKMYVYDPQRLQNSSPQRYDYLRNYVFGGAEYEDGHQKQP